MQFLLLILVSSLAVAFDANLSLFSRQTQICFVLPIAPSDFNGNIACGSGSVIAGCTCCADGLTPCSATQQICQTDSAGNTICVDGTDLALTNCVTQSQCPSTEQCCTLSDGSVGCCSSGGSGTSGAAPTTTYDNSAPTTTANVDTDGSAATSDTGSAATTAASNSASIALTAGPDLTLLGLLEASMAVLTALSALY